MHILKNFDNEHFQDLVQELKKTGISPLKFKAAEFFIRHFLHTFDPVSQFPDEEFPLAISEDSIKKYWKSFEVIHLNIEWGFHPLAADYQGFDIDSLKDRVTSLYDYFPTRSEFSEVNRLKENFGAKANEMLQSIRDVENLFRKAKPKLWKDKVTLYLYVSKIMYKTVFDDELGRNNNGINLLLRKKADAYFQTSDLEISSFNPSSSLRPNRIPFMDVDRKFFEYLKTYQAEQIIRTFRPYGRSSI